MEEELDGAEEAAHALVAQPFVFEVRGGVPTVHTSASVGGEQWKQRWQQCMRDTQRGDAVCVEAMQATRTSVSAGTHAAREGAWRTQYWWWWWVLWRVWLYGW